MRWAAFFQTFWPSRCILLPVCSYIAKHIRVVIFDTLCQYRFPAWTTSALWSKASAYGFLTYTTSTSWSASNDPIDSIDPRSATDLRLFIRKTLNYPRLELISLVSKRTAQQQKSRLTVYTSLAQPRQFRNLSFIDLIGGERELNRWEAKIDSVAATSEMHKGRSPTIHCDYERADKLRR